MRLLVIEDNEALAANLTEIFEIEGYDVQTAHDGRAGLERAKEGFDLALVDVRLPDVSGTTLVPSLRAHAEHAEVIMATANADLNSAIEAVQAGAFAYLTKPVRTEDLLMTVARARERVELRRRSVLLQQALESSERRLRGLVESVEAIILTVDASGKILFASRAAREILGWAPADLRGRDLIDALSCAERRYEWTGLIEGANVRRVEATEVECMHTDGSTRRLMWRWTPGVEGGERVLYGVGTDVTRQRELEREAVRSEKLAAAGTLTAGLAHEIRNPLNAAGLQLSVLSRLLSRIPDADEAQLNGPLDLVRSELSRLDGLLEDFLAFARPREMNPTGFDFSALVDAVVRFEDESARECGKTLDAELDDDVRATGDPNAIRQVLINVVNNALAAAETRVLVRLNHVAGDAVLVVEDDGPGLPPDVVNRVFEPFFTTKPTGTGLGMAIAHSIVTTHGGEIALESAPGRGTQVRVRLPKRVPRAALK